MKRIWKLIGAGLVFSGSLFHVLGKFFGPGKLVLAEGSFWGEKAQTLGWVMLLMAPIVYVVAEWDDLFPKKGKAKDRFIT